MNAPKCETECRDELVHEIADKLPKSVLWKAIVLFFMVWGVAVGIYGSGLSERKEAIKENRVAAQENKQAIAVIQNDLDYLKQGQHTILMELRKEK